MLEGEVELTFRGEQLVAKAGETVNVPANAPHGFRNASAQSVRLLCLCTPPAQEVSSPRSVSRSRLGLSHLPRWTTKPNRLSSTKRRHSHRSTATLAAVGGMSAPNHRDGGQSAVPR